MNAILTEQEHIAKQYQASLGYCHPTNHRERHKANAREWYRRYRLVLDNKDADGNELGFENRPLPHVIWDAMLSECKKGNIDPAYITGDKSVSSASFLPQ